MTSRDPGFRLTAVADLLPLPAIERKSKYHWFVVGTVCIGAFMAALDASIVNIALPRMKAFFGVQMNIIEWVSLVYLLTLGALIVPFGRMADMFGRRWMYAFGFLIFIVGSLLCGISGDLTLLLTARALQAVGAAMLQANSVSIITAATPRQDLGKAIGIQASAQGIGLSLGPTIGGALLSYLNWHWIFLINLPIGIFGTALGILLLPKDISRQGREKFDVIGGLLLIPALVAIIFSLNMGMSHGWNSKWVIASYVVFAVFLPMFLYRESKVAYALVDLMLFKIKTFSFGNIAGTLSFTVMYAVLFLAPFYMDEVQKFGPLTSGLLLTIVPVGMTLLTPISGALADRYGVRVPTTMGMLVIALGCGGLALMGTAATMVFLVIGLFFVGSGMGIFTPPNNSSVMSSVPRERLGIAGGILNMSRTLGMSLGVALGGLTYELFLQMNTGRRNGVSMPQALHFSFREAFICIAGMAIIGLFLSNFKSHEK